MAQKGLKSGEKRHLLKVVDHEEDVRVAHLGLLSFAVHGVFAGRCKHFLWKGQTDRTDERSAASLTSAQINAGPASYLTFLLVDVDISCVWARAHGTRHHVVQLQESRVISGYCWRQWTKNNHKIYLPSDWNTVIVSCFLSFFLSLRGRWLNATLLLLCSVCLVS